MPQPSNARILAPIALVAFLLAVIVVAAGSLGGDDAPTALSPPPETPATDTTTTPASTAESEPTATQETPDPGGTVVVQAGDTPSAIAEREGIALERLLELNPEIDPSGLRVGQELRLEP